MTGADPGPGDGLRRRRPQGAVNNWSAATKWHVARTVKGLKAGRHTLQIVVNGTKGSTKGKGTQVVLDAAKVGTKLVATPAVTTGWSRSTSSSRPPAEVTRRLHWLAPPPRSRSAGRRSPG